MSRAIEIEGRKRSDGAPVDDARTPTRSSGAPAVMVCGAEGTGKTTLIAALAKSARNAGDSTPENEISPSFATAGGRVTLVETHWDDAEPRYEATGGPAGDFSLLLTDTRRGVDTTVRRSAYILSLLGVGNVALVVNQMDLADFSQERFEKISSEFRDFAEQLDFKDVDCIPASSLSGDNLFTGGAALGWYSGPTVTERLEAAVATPVGSGLPFRMAVRDIVEIAPDRVAYAGTLAGGIVRSGDAVVALPEGRETRVERIVGAGGEEREQARAGDSVTLVLSDALNVTAGHILASADALAEVSDQIAAHVIWTAKEPMLPGRSYVLKAGGQTGMATVTVLKHKINLDNLDHIAGPTLERDEIGYCNLSIDQPIVFDPCRENRETGSFVLFDRLSGEKAGDGLIEFGLRRATNISWQALYIDKHARADRKRQRPCVLWFTGLSGAGKSTLANLLEKRLHARGQHTYVLDGDNVRHGLNKDLGFTDADRVENIRRVAETAKLMVDAGLIVMASFISPFRSERRMARELFEDGEFIEIFVDTPLEICERRDPKGLYQKARAGLIKNFTGIDSDYEPPERAEIRLEAGGGEPDTLVGELIAELEKRGFI